jgi:hypothetical protein
MLANCEQAGKIVENVTNQRPGMSVSYEDMWRFTLVNYNAGPGCLSDAMEKANENGEGFTWDNVAGQLDEVCKLAVDYVNDISKAGPSSPSAIQTPTEPTEEPDDSEATPTPDNDGE